MSQAASSPTIVVAGKQSITAGWIAGALTQAFPAHRVVSLYEQPVSRKKLLRGRARRLGWLTAFGHLLFIGGATPVLRRLHRARYAELVEAGNQRFVPARIIEAYHVASMNAPEAHHLLQSLQPVLVVLAGTRILKADTLECVDAPFVNLHAGITPAYRGVHGAYWALVEGHPERAGATVHRVDKGIDTGEVLERVVVPISKQDAFVTYPLLQALHGIPALIRQVEHVLAGTATEVGAGGLPSRLYYHPTLWTYLFHRLRGVR